MTARFGSSKARWHPHTLAFDASQSSSGLRGGRDAHVLHAMHNHNTYHASMETRRGCVWEVLGNGSLVVTYCDDLVEPAQWDAYLMMIQERRGRSSVRFLIYSLVTPPREVLSRLAGAVRGQPWQVALLSPSTAVRFAASTFSLIVKGFRFFPPERLDDALAHVCCEGAELEQARAALARMRGDPGSVRPQP